MSFRVGDDVVVEPVEGGYLVLAPGAAVIDHLDGPYALAFSPGGDLYVSNLGDNTVRRWDGSQLTTVIEGLSGPFGLAFGPDGALAIANAYGNSVSRWDGSTLTTLAGNVDQPYALAFA